MGKVIMKSAIKSKFKLETPVLYLVFNRLDTVKQTFPEIKKAKPKQLFIAADGPRNSEEKKKTDAVRKYVLDNINWKCEVKTLFREKNLGCKYAVAGAIDWFFENVEQGIILEDDCLPSQSFFRFCQEMLERYRGEKEVMQVSGTNFIDYKTRNIGESYYFSKNAHIWGWATWGRAWKSYKVNLSKKDIELVSSFNLNFLGKLRMKRDIRDSMKPKGTWDSQWSYNVLLKEGLCIVPKYNLVENIGFGEGFTNTASSKADLKFLVQKRNSLFFPLKHPIAKSINRAFDFYEQLKEYQRIILKKLHG